MTDGPAGAPGGATPPAGPGRPRNVVVVLLDSLNRHHVGAYGSDEFATPNLDRFAARAVRFERHHVGSLPCMPARHDLLCGALDFLWRPWGSVEIWERAITHALREAGVTTMLCTDHPHLFETGGENYHTDFSAWSYVRGHEGDPWKTRADPSWVGAPALPSAPGWVHRHYDDTRTWFREESDFPGPRTMTAATEWLATSADAHDRWLLFVDEFDPHEPFDTPEPWAGIYDPDWDDPLIIWPPYSTDTVANGVLTERQARHVRANYGSKLTMIDHWFGRLLDELDRQGRWDDTAVIVTTDHGHYLGEHDVFGKPGVPLYEPMSHIPLLVAWPGMKRGTCDALTTSVDLHATLADVFGVTVEHRTHGHSLVPLLEGTADAVRDWALAGIWGREVHLFDGHTKYARGPAGANEPLSMWSNRWSTMPLPVSGITALPPPDDRAWLDRMPGSSIPVIRQPFVDGDLLPFWALGHPMTGHHLWDLDEDPFEEHDLVGDPGAAGAEADCAEQLREVLLSIEAPDDQLVRLGLA
ncbi:MAG TPA: sulfatase [Acidimicrobiales bacterium]|nr:sulfatase [Acidimicrobiales bacterium]